MPMQTHKYFMIILTERCYQPFQGRGAHGRKGSTCRKWWEGQNSWIKEKRKEIDMAQEQR